MLKSSTLSVISIEDLKTLKYQIFLVKHLFFLLLVISFAVLIKKIFKGKELIEILKILVLINNMKEYYILYYMNI